MAQPDPPLPDNSMPQRDTSRRRVFVRLLVLACLIVVACAVIYLALSYFAPARVPVPWTPPTPTPLVVPKPWTAPEGVREPVPALYARDDPPGGIDYGRDHPEYGPVGGYIRVRWIDIHTGWGRFNWEAIDKYLRGADGMTVTLADGRVVAKPMVLTVAIYSQAGDDPTSFADHAPKWLREGVLGGCYTIGSGECVEQPVPCYDDNRYQSAFKDMVMALGDRYGDNRLITAVAIAAGYDEETAATRLVEINGCEYWKDLYELVTKAEYEDFVKKAMDWYRDAFPNTPLYIQAGNAEWDHREIFVDYASKKSPPIGYKPNAIAPDVNAAYGWDSTHTGRGLIQLAEAYRDKIPLAYEPKAAPYQIPKQERRQHAYWMTLNALAHDADFIDYQSYCRQLPIEECSWFPYLAAADGAPDYFGGFTNFVARNLGQNSSTSHEVWIVLRDSEFPTGRYVSGEPGDWDHLLYRRTPGDSDATTIAWAESLPTQARLQVYGRQLRLTNGQLLSFDVEDTWIHHSQMPVDGGGETTYVMRIWYLDRGLDRFTIAYKNHRGEQQQIEVRKEGTDRVVSTSLSLPDLLLENQMDQAVDFVLDDEGDGEEYLHLIWLGASAAGHDSLLTPTAMPTLPAAGPTATPTPSETIIRQEAEDGFLAEPMGKTFDTTSSSGFYILSREGSGDHSMGHVTFSLAIPRSGNYWLWGRVRGPDTSSDSFYVSVDRSNEMEWHFRSGDWLWAKVTDGQGAPQAWSLGEGEHTVTFRTREDGAQLDVIEMVNSAAYMPEFVEPWATDTPTPTRTPTVTPTATPSPTPTHADRYTDHHTHSNGSADAHRYTD